MDRECLAQEAAARAAQKIEAPRDPVRLSQSATPASRADLVKRLNSYSTESLRDLGELTAAHYGKLMTRPAPNAAAARSREEYRSGAILVGQALRARGITPGPRLADLENGRRQPICAQKDRGQGRGGASL